MQRLNLIRRQLSFNNLKKERRQITSSLDYFNYDQFLNNEEREYRKRLRDYLDKEITVA